MDFSIGTLLFYLLLLSGDVSPNPGPVRFPCAVCHLPVRSNQRALLCDECGLWCHCTCCGVDKGQYQSYQSLSCFNWLCPRCLNYCLPFHDCSFLCSPDVKLRRGTSEELSSSSCDSTQGSSFYFPSPPST